ncbi:MAG: hypothetical protein EOP42_02300 [Sphingobacteriaceae bacterium]|nr:MAG: hypothetical protein EOP42_02300 [Sphingobacteriaceae bacterium]
MRLKNLKQQITDSYKKLRATNIISNFINLSSIQLSNTLLIILTIPIITRLVGIGEFGIIMFASRFSQLAGGIINYGTGQSGVRDVAANLNNNKKLSTVFYNTLSIRLIIFFLFAVVLFVLYKLEIQYFTYILLAVTMVLAEVLNPLFFFIGAEKLKVFNLANLVCNAVTIILIIALIKGPKDAGLVNLILGGVNAITYGGLLIYIISTFNLSFAFPLKTDLLKIGRDNFYLTTNNISVQLQQSIMIFALTRFEVTAILGAYSLCDRIIGQCRNLLITISNAIYPNCVHLYNQEVALWNAYRKKMKYLIAGLFFCGSIVLFVFADFIIYTLSKEHNPTAVIFLKTMALVPAISALNVLNVLDLLLKNNTAYIFKIAIILLVIAATTAFVLLKYNQFLFVGTFTLIVETSAWLMYEYIIKKPALKNA